MALHVTAFDTAVPRVAAPPLHAGGGWLGVPLNVARDLRGRIVLLHFFAGSSMLSARVSEELRGLQRRYGEVLTIVGVHAPRFGRERAPAPVHDAVARMRISHPVLDDHELVNWDAYAVRAPSTLVLIDHQGRVVGNAEEGLGHAGALTLAIERLIDEAEHDGSLGLRRDVDHGEGLLDVDLDTSGLAGDGELAFPSGLAVQVVADSVSRIAIADTGNDRVLLCRPDGQLDGILAGYYQPHGLYFDADGSLLVCETGRDAVWQVHPSSGDRRLLTDRVAAPCDVIRWGERLVVAGAGHHVLVALAADGSTELLAGDGAEALRDGPAPTGSSLAEPRGLAVAGDGTLAFVDAQSCALRILDRPGGTVSTLAGSGAATWGAQDGGRETARLQLPLALTATGDELYVADTFNGQLRRWHDGALTTVPVASLSEPAALAALPDGRLLVADRAKQNVVLLEPDTGRIVNWDIGRPGADTPAALVPPTVLLAADSALELELTLELDGDELDSTAGPPPIQIHASAAAEWILGDPRDWTAEDLPVQLTIPVRRGAGRIIIEAHVACGDGEIVRERRIVQAVDVMAR